MSTRLADLERDVSERRTFEFADAQDRWWHAQLAQLVADLKAFTNEKEGGLYSLGISEAHGWGVKKRAEFARTIADRSLSGTDAATRWEEARTAIAKSPKYGGMRMTAQLGLLPIGEDPESHLWEFAHLPTGDPAVRGAEGKLVLNDATGLVFVLIPGGTFWMGAQKTDPSGHNFDPQANFNESPVAEMTLSAFFLSKYEMTQGQWRRSVGRSPSSYGPGATFGDKICSLSNPVEQVNWNDCSEALSRFGLVLPTEAQWEYGARAGTESAWWTGDEKETLAGAVNLADAYGKSNSGPSAWVYEDWLNDGCTIHASVGSYRANAFGLHDVAGNVWEWCRDGFGSYNLPTVANDGERMGTSARYRVYRGGSYNDVASSARSAIRWPCPPEQRYANLGLRPARAITP